MSKLFFIFVAVVVSHQVHAQNNLYANNYNNILAGMQGRNPVGGVQTVAGRPAVNQGTAIRTGTQVVAVPSPPKKQVIIVQQTAQQQVQPQPQPIVQRPLLRESQIPTSKRTRDIVNDAQHVITSEVNKMREKLVQERNKIHSEINHVEKEAATLFHRHLPPQQANHYTSRVSQVLENTKRQIDAIVQSGGDNYVKKAEEIHALWNRGFQEVEIILREAGANLQEIEAILNAPKHRLNNQYHIHRAELVEHDRLADMKFEEAKRIGRENIEDITTATRRNLAVNFDNLAIVTGNNRPDLYQNGVSISSRANAEIHMAMRDVDKNPERAYSQAMNVIRNALNTYDNMLAQNGVGPNARNQLLSNAFREMETNMKLGYAHTADALDNLARIGIRY